MDPLVAVLLFGAMPAVGTLAGAGLADLVRLKGRGLSMVLHVAAGAILAVVGVELLPRSLAGLPTWLAVAAFLAGGLFFILLDWATDLVGAISGAEEARATASAWVIFAGIAVDLVTDGLMIGAGAALSRDLALVLGLGLLLVDSAESFATFGTLAGRGVGRRWRWLAAGGLAVLIVLAALGGHAWVRGREALGLGILAFTGGTLLTLVVEEIAPEAHRRGQGRFMTLLFLVGFAAFAFLSALLA